MIIFTSPYLSIHCGNSSVVDGDRPVIQHFFMRATHGPPRLSVTPTVLLLSLMPERCLRSHLHREKKKTNKEAAGKKNKASLKEGGKKGQDLSGMHDLGGMIFFTICLEQCKVDRNLQAAIDVRHSSTNSCSATVCALGKGA